MIPALQALERLKEGNKRFAADGVAPSIVTSQAKRDTLIEKQEPFAIILGCSDSRAPAEIIFDQGLGTLFVIRVAGNIIAPSLVGSVEFAAEGFGTRLVVVLGHTRCGAVSATLEQLERPVESRSHNLHSIVDRIRPSLSTLMDMNLSPDELMHHAIRANIRASVNHLRHGSEIIEHQIQHEGLLVLGAEYSIETGVVDFFDGIPEMGL